MKKEKISVSMIVKNESSNIRRSLDSVKGADEIVVIDTGSKDDTIDIVKEYTDKVYYGEEYLWRDDFESQGDISNLKNIISRLRKKIPLLNIENIYGFGYRLTTKNYL